jgi:nucleotide-binding universal stress UspA family protein
MRFLICSDGMPAADDATRIGGMLARACRADTTLIGIAEESRDEQPLRQALDTQAEFLRGEAVTPKIVVRAGEPIAGILQETSSIEYDIVIIGSRRTTTSGPHWRTRRTYEVIKAVPVPVLMAVGECRQLRRFLVCTGGKSFIDDAVQLTAKIASAVGGTVTLLHVMAEPPAIYASLVRLEEDLDRLMESKSELGRNLVRQKEQVAALGVNVEVRIRHGIVVDQVFAEAEQGDHDLIVTGSSQASGTFQHYIMGDLTRMIVNRADCPVLVARSAPRSATSFWGRMRNVFAPPST